jgi:hypothetical protein
MIHLIGNNHGGGEDVDVGVEQDNVIRGSLR